MSTSRALGPTAKTYGLLVALGATLALLTERRALVETREQPAAEATPVSVPRLAAAPPFVEAAPVEAPLQTETEPSSVAARPRRSTLCRVANAAGLALTVAAVVFWALFLRPQSLGGPAAYVLVSGKSMLPRYHTGDLVLVEQQSRYHVGEVIAYHVPKGDPMAGAQVIHRIIGGDAQHGFVVQGDNRTAPDVWRPKPRTSSARRRCGSRTPSSCSSTSARRCCSPDGGLLRVRSRARIRRSNGGERPDEQSEPLAGEPRDEDGTVAGGGRMKRRVLVSEPNAEVRRFLELTMRAARLRAGPGRAHRPSADVDAVLLEPAWPASRTILHRFGDDVPPVVCLSVYPREAGLAPPESVAYLVKPSSSAALGDALRGVLGG